MRIELGVIRECPQRLLDPKRPKKDQKWCLMTRDGKKLLGRHRTKASAERQERLIEMKRHGRPTRVSGSCDLGAKKGSSPWIAQAVVIKKTHPKVSTPEEAWDAALRHARGTPMTVVEKPKAYHVIFRRKECCEPGRFGSKAHGAHVTVRHCKRAKGKEKKKGCK